MKFLNKTYEQCIDAGKKLNDRDKTAFINLYPNLKDAVVGLIIMVSGPVAKNNTDTSDWECDFENIVWTEILEDKNSKN